MGALNQYVDLFKTYHIEYIIIIIFLIAIIFFWRYLSKRPKGSKPPAKGKKAPQKKKKTPAKKKQTKR